MNNLREAIDLLKKMQEQKEAGVEQQPILSDTYMLNALHWVSKAAGHPDGRESLQQVISKDGVVAASDGMHAHIWLSDDCPRNDVVAAPDIRELVPDTPPVAQFAINTQHLFEALGMPSGVVLFKFYGDDKQVVMESIDGKFIAIFMPVSLTDIERVRE